MIKSTGTFLSAVFSCSDKQRKQGWPPDRMMQSHDILPPVPSQSSDSVPDNTSLVQDESNHFQIQQGSV